MNEDQSILSFLDHICVKFGFCLSESVRFELASKGPYKPDDFVRVVMEAEGLDPDSAHRYFTDLRNEFIVFFDR